jgi:hypothetical protein
MKEERVDQNRRKNNYLKPDRKVQIFQISWVFINKYLSHLNYSDFSLEEDFQAVIMALQHPSIVHDWKIVDIIFDSMLPSPCSPLGEQKKFTSANFCPFSLIYLTPLLILFVVAKTHIL